MQLSQWSASTSSQNALWLEEEAQSTANVVQATSTLVEVLAVGADDSSPSHNDEQLQRRQHNTHPSSAFGQGRQRAKTGCITCRVRKKRCDENKPFCMTCLRLGIQCHGYGNKRPQWAKSQKQLQVKRPKQANNQQTNESSVSEGQAILQKGEMEQILSVHPRESDYPLRHDSEWSVPEDDTWWSSLMSFAQPQQPSPSLSAVDLADTPMKKASYLHHYLNSVLPLQYRFYGASIADFIAQMAFSRPHVLDSVCSLSALHIFATRNQRINCGFGEINQARDGNVMTLEDISIEDEDLIMAKQSHFTVSNRLQYLSGADLISEDIILTSLFTISFYLFQGGTSTSWIPALATSRRCLSAALNCSPELLKLSNLPKPPLNADTTSSSSSLSPWVRYKPLMAIMIWMDIIGAIVQGKSTKNLSQYRQLLDRSKGSGMIAMDSVMGCDNTTLLALAELSALCEWKDCQVNAGSLSIKVLLKKASQIEQLLEKRDLLEGRLEDFDQSHDDPISLATTDVYFAVAKVYLATLIHGPFPKVHDVADAVMDTIVALEKIDSRCNLDCDLYRSLVFPITIAGCHAATLEQEKYFKSRFDKLSSDASSFGNSKQALELMEYVWNWRKKVQPCQAICWRVTMAKLGWEAGLLLV